MTIFGRSCKNNRTLIGRFCSDRKKLDKEPRFKETKKFQILADWTGIVETELFAQTCKSYGLATVRYPVLEVEAKIKPSENGRGFPLRVLRAGKPRGGAVAYSIQSAHCVFNPPANDCL